MAVYTSINKNNLTLFLSQYNIGTLKNFEGILEGIENTNYRVTTSQNTFILTIFEKRVNVAEIPFFIELQHHLSNKNIKCPHPIANHAGQFINTIENKPCVIMSFLAGKKINEVKSHHCYQVGQLIAKIHQLTQDFSLSRQNNLHQKYWKDIFDKCQNNYNNRYLKLLQKLEKEIQFLEKNWPINLPSGIIHADVFQDNVFFENNKLSGLIDFYFSCNDFYAYELAICINAWSFDKNGKFNYNNFSSLLQGYQSLRILSKKEINDLPILLRGATMRILLTRLHDQLHHPPGAFVIPKEPLEYVAILKFHHQNPHLDFKTYDH